jgi:hypothetical protein
MIRMPAALFWLLVVLVRVAARSQFRNPMKRSNSIPRGFRLRSLRRHPCYARPGKPWQESGKDWIRRR